VLGCVLGCVLGLRWAVLVGEILCHRHIE
jgi:hypothetical protein